MDAESASAPKRLFARVQERVKVVREWVERTIFWRVWERLLENEFIDRSVALAAKAFVSLFPALLVVAAFMPDHVRTSILQTITRRLGITGDGLTTVKSAFASASDTRKATGILGLLLTFFYINSFVTALQRVYTRAWRRPPGKRVSGYALGVAWLVGVIAYFAMVGGVRALFGNGPQTAGFAIVAFAAAILFWTATPWFLLQRQVRFRPLLTTGLVTGAGIGIYAASATAWMPNTVSQNQHQFGFFGVALALVTWLSGAATIIVVGASTGAVIAADPGKLGQLARGQTEEVLTPGAAPFLPAPIQPRRLANAFGFPRGEDEDDDVS
jgi:membrane protein